MSFSDERDHEEERAVRAELAAEGLAELAAEQQHPAWCTIQHAPGWPIHSAPVGEVEISEGVSVSVELNDYGNGRGPRVTLATWTDEDQAVVEFTPAQARALAGFLTAAADTLDGTPPIGGAW